MKILTRYLLMRYLALLSLTLAGMVAAELAIDLLERARRVALHPEALPGLALYLTYRVPRVIQDLAPFSTLLASLLTLGMMERRREIMAIRASGLSAWRIAVPLLTASFSLGAVIFIGGTAPTPIATREANLIKDRLAHPPAQEAGPSDGTSGGRIWVRLDAERILTAGTMDPVQDAMFDVELYRIGPPFDLREWIYARSARFEPAAEADSGRVEPKASNKVEPKASNKDDRPAGEWRLYSGWRREYSAAGTVHFSRFERFPADLGRGPVAFRKLTPKADEATVLQLTEYVRRLKDARLPAGYYDTELQLRFAIPFSVPILGLLGVALGLRGGVQGGISRGVGISLAAALVYGLMHSTAVSLGNGGVVPAAAAAWFSNAVFAALAAALIARISRPGA